MAKYHLESFDEHLKFRIAMANKKAAEIRKVNEDYKEALKGMSGFDRVEIIKTQGHKDDSGKPRYDLIPTEFLTGTADILEIGSRKYAPRNWEKGMDWGRPFGALMRHMWAWWGGENKDPETGKSHLWHAACNLAFLVAYEARGIGNDTRNKNV